jgi:hypothetical protein
MIEVYHHMYHSVTTRNFSCVLSLPGGVCPALAPPATHCSNSVSITHLSIPDPAAIIRSEVRFGSSLVRSRHSRSDPPFHSAAVSGSVLCHGSFGRVEASLDSSGRAGVRADVSTP